VTCQAIPSSQHVGKSFPKKVQEPVARRIVPREKAALWRRGLR
jgi:hypothetical protein